ncbi:PREDICTED: TMV resistance protein N-like [Prunus mume]|uniref:TMV resistance protein N-like n=1 Tax=Prunus mume TaxID=102107 RepID=A0ABM0NCS9_PRUMU|nr:PREDICTED: TMV resistance protein N-like [Prunus mume]
MANQRASSSSAPFTKSWKYHVFLSFRGFDTRLNFTSPLYRALRREGINTFMADHQLGRGEEISNALLTVIEDSKISVVVFSENYASSKWCLDELVKILDCKESNQQLVILVFYKVNPSDVRNHRGSFGDALANMDCNNVEKVNRWKEALSQAGKLAGFTLSDEYRSEDELIHKIVQDISQQVIDRTYLYVTEYPVRMRHPVEYILKLLDLGEKDVRMAGLWGTGGIGKTTIAKAVYNSIAHEFEGCCFLESVRECSMSHGGLAKLQKTLLFEILKGEKLKVTNVYKGVTMIKEWLRGRRVLLVLDDVDDMEQLHKLVGACDWFGVGSRIIITTRDKQLLTAHDVNLIHEVKILDDPEALKLFCWHAFKRSEPPLDDYVKLARRAIRYAQGLPLALKVLGSCLYGGNIDKWEAALDGFKSTKIQDVLKISYNALDHSVQEVFLDIACFFKGNRRSYVIETLAACGLNARYSIEGLIERALISVEHEEYIQMHDLLEEMGKDIVKQESPTEAGGRSRLWFYEDVKHVLTNNTLESFPKIVDKMESLCSLDLGRTAIKKLPASVGHLIGLKKLDLFGSTIKELPSSIGNLTALEALLLDGSAIEELPSSIGNLTALQRLNLEGCENLANLPQCCKRLVEILVQLSASIKWVHVRDCISLERFSTLSKILEDGDMQGISYMDLSNCHRLCDNLALDVSKIAKLFNEMKFRGNARIVFRLPGSSSEVLEWFTFRNYLDDSDESKFNYIDHDGRSTHTRDEWRVSGGETQAGNVWLECMSLFPRWYCLPFKLSTSDMFRGTTMWWDCIPLFLDDQFMPPIFRVTVSGKGLRVKSIGAHLVHNNMSRDYDDYYPGKQIDENGLDDISLCLADRDLEMRMDNDHGMSDLFPDGYSDW